MEYEIAEWLLHNKQDLALKIASRAHVPPSIYLDIYEEGVVSIVREEIAYALQLDAESALVYVNKQLILDLAKELLTPPS